MGVETIVKPHPSDAGFNWEVKMNGERYGFGWCTTRVEAESNVNRVVEERKLEDEGTTGAGAREGGSTGADRRESP